MNIGLWHKLKIQDNDLRNKKLHVDATGVRDPTRESISTIKHVTEAIDYTGSLAIAVGWGRTGETKPISDELRKVHLPILSQEECDQAGYAENRIMHDKMLCAGYLNGERDACFVSIGNESAINSLTFL